MKTKTTNECKTTGLCHYNALTRTKFFRGMLLTDEHLRAEQAYHRESLKRLNRSLWGAGIICGLEVRKVSKDHGLCIKVQPGLALDCAGNVIDVCKSVTLDLASICKEKYPDGCAPEDKTEPIEKYLVIRYAEIAADPQPVLTPEEDCAPSGGTKCEGSKYREGFCLEFRDECPNCPVCGEEEDDDKADGLVPTFIKAQGSAYDDAKATNEFETRKPDCMDAPPCSTCDCDCDHAAVGLAKVIIDCEKNTIEVECECRSYVWSPRLLQWLICRVLARIDKINPARIGLKKYLPKSALFASNPLHAAWNAGSAVLRAPGFGGVRRQIAEVKTQLEELEYLKKAQADQVKEFREKLRDVEALKKQLAGMDAMRKQIEEVQKITSPLGSADNVKDLVDRVKKIKP